MTTVEDVLRDPHVVEGLSSKELRRLLREFDRALDMRITGDLHLILSAAHVADELTGQYVGGRTLVTNQLHAVGAVLGYVEALLHAFHRLQDIAAETERRRHPGEMLTLKDLVEGEPEEG